MKIKFTSVLIGVKDILKSKIFYENVFGVVFDEVRPPFSSFILNGIEFQIEENSADRSSNWDKKYLGTPKGLCFETDKIEDFLKNVSSNRGNVSEIKTYSWGYREADFSDLDGNSFIVEQKII